MEAAWSSRRSARYGVEAGTVEGLTGVWTPERRKIGSIGIHVSRGVTTHGFAVNVNNDLQPFEWIVPCGIEHCRMSSVTRETGRDGRTWTTFARRRLRASSARALGADAGRASAASERLGEPVAARHERRPTVT